MTMAANPAGGAAAERDRAVGALVGLAVGDALGTTLEFEERDSRPPVTEMEGAGPFRLQPGQWTDDTSQALCLAESLLARGRLDPGDLMTRFVAWRREGHNSVTGKCFDIGNATAAALDRYERTGDPLAGSAAPNTAGNGSLMRLSPAAIRWWRDAGRAREAARRQSRTTHAAPEAVAACDFFAGALVEAISGRPKDFVLRSRKVGDGSGKIAEIAAGSWRGKSRDEIRSTGYVVHTLEAALWAVGNADSFRESLTLAVNLGGDADSVGAVTGQLAGALRGYRAIPDSWLAPLAWRDRLRDLAENLFAAGAAESPAPAE